MKSTLFQTGNWLWSSAPLDFGELYLPKDKTLWEDDMKRVIRHFDHDSARR